jgi:hypothetical protein
MPTPAEGGEKKRKNNPRAATQKSCGAGIFYFFRGENEL